MTTGVAQLENVVYVAYAESAIIRTFNADTLSPLNNDIHVEGMTDPRYMVVCHSGRQLFITEDSCIWHVSVDQSQDLQLQWLPLVVSLMSEHLLVTSQYPSSTLHVYSTTDAAHIGAVQLPQYMQSLHHAVETTRGTCVVAHRGTSQNGDQHAASKMLTVCRKSKSQVL